MNTGTIFKIFKYQASKCAKIHLITTFSCFVFGIFLLMIIMNFASDADTYVYLGSLVAGLGFLICMFCLCIRNLLADFIHIIKIGVSRKNYIAGTVLYHVIFALLMAGIIYILLFIETAVIDNIYKNTAINLDPSFKMIQNWLFGNVLNFIGLELAVVLAGICFGALILKFGLAGFWIPYCIGMILGFSFETVAGKYIKIILEKINPAFIFPSVILILLLLCIPGIRVYLKKEL